MRKNSFIKSFALTAMALAALSCAKEGADADSQQSEVSFTVEVPAAPATKGIADASTTNELICQVFLDDDNYTPVPELTQTAEIDAVTHKASVKFSLIKGNSYTFIFWAQTKGTGYYETSDLRSVKMNCDVVKANDPTMDAFCKTIKGKSAILAHGSVTLRRVLAQVNFGTVIPNRTDALKVTSSSMTLTKVPDTFHPLEGKGSKSCEGSVDIEFKNNTAVTNEKLNVEGTDYDYISTAFVFAPGESRLITDASTTVTLSNGKTTTIKAPNAPVKRNCRTNILGDLLTVDGVWNITVSPGFDGDDINYDEISTSLGNGRSVTLSKDYSVTNSEWKGILIPSGKESTLNLNGHRFANENGKLSAAKAALEVKGKLTINGDGEVYCEGGASNNAIIVHEGGHLVINGGSYSVGKDAAGKCNTTIYVENLGKTGKVEIYGGTFTNEEGSNGHAFVLNQDDELTGKHITVYGGTFIGFNPADNSSDGDHTNYVADGYKSVKTSDSPETWEVIDASISVTNQTELESALSSLSGTDDVTLKLGAGEYELTKAGYKGHITVKGAGKDITKLASNKAIFDNKEISFEDLTFNCNNVWADDARTSQFPRTDVTYRNCILNGTVGLIINNSAQFYDCTFNIDSNDKYCIEYYGNTNSKAVFENCTFNTHGKCILVYNETANIFDISVTDCRFNASEKVAGKTAIQMHTEYEISGVLKINKTTATGFDSSINDGLWNDINNSTKIATKKFTVIIDGETVQTAE